MSCFVFINNSVHTVGKGNVSCLYSLQPTLSGRVMYRAYIHCSLYTVGKGYVSCLYALQPTLSGRIMYRVYTHCSPRCREELCIVFIFTAAHTVGQGYVSCLYSLQPTLSGRVMSWSQQMILESSFLYTSVHTILILYIFLMSRKQAKKLIVIHQETLQKKIDKSESLPSTRWLCNIFHVLEVVKVIK